jgi:hypothetical protein
LNKSVSILADVRFSVGAHLDWFLFEGPAFAGDSVNSLHPRSACMINFKHWKQMRLQATVSLLAA